MREGADLGARPVLHLHQNLGRAHLGQLTDAVVPQPVFPCHMTQAMSGGGGGLLAGRGGASLTGRVAVTFASVKRNVTEALPVLVPAPAEVHAAVQPALDQQPAWEDRRRREDSPGRVRGVSGA